MSPIIKPVCLHIDNFVYYLNKKCTVLDIGTFFENHRRVLNCVLYMHVIHALVLEEYDATGQVDCGSDIVIILFFLFVYSTFVLFFGYICIMSIYNFIFFVHTITLNKVLINIGVLSQ